MLVLDINKVRAGDIILIRKNDSESITIRQMSGSEYSHAILYVGVTSCIESEGDGVHSQNLQRINCEDYTDIVVLRVKDEENKKVIPGAIVFARQKVGTEYSTREARIAVSKPQSAARQTNRQFCTRFVAQAYKSSGLQLVSNPDYCSPQEILESNYLTVVENVLREASAKEIDFILNSVNPLKLQREATNKIFDSARNISQLDLQTFEQLSSYVINNPDKDTEITRAILDSGYLSLWEIEIKENPWFYDYQLFDNYFNDIEPKIIVAYYLATTEQENRERFILTLNSLEFGQMISNLNYFDVLISLYEKQIELSHTRENIGIDILNKYNDDYVRMSESN